MKLLICPHCGHAFKLKSPERNPFALSNHCPTCSDEFVYGIKGWLYFVKFLPVVML